MIKFPLQCLWHYFPVLLCISNCSLIVCHDQVCHLKRLLVRTLLVGTCPFSLCKYHICMFDIKVTSGAGTCLVIPSKITRTYAQNTSNNFYTFSKSHAFYYQYYLRFGNVLWLRLLPKSIIYYSIKKKNKHLHSAFEAISSKRCFVAWGGVGFFFNY